MFVYMERKSERILFVVYVIKRIKWIIGGAILGAMLGGIIYYIEVIATTPELEYRTEETFYVEYSKKENGDINYAYNQAGWSYVIMFDEILDIVMEYLSIPITKEELREIVSSENISDYKILTVVVTSTDPTIAKPILEAFVPAMEAYGESSMHIDYIERAVEPSTTKPIYVTFVTVKAIALSGLLGALICVFVVGFFAWCDTTFQVEHTLSNCFSIPVLGTVLSTKEIWRKASYLMHLEQVHSKGKLVTISCEKNIDPLVYKEYDGVILEVVAGKTKYSMVEQVISSFEETSCKVEGLTLVEATPWVQTIYYGR